ncbi:MAG: hypothetical protein RPT95_13815 [Candidatus Sedimenticola sp. (ex Thyasira tokunagai)]
MSIDWIIVSQIAGPIIAVFVGAAISRYLSERERLIAYYGHVASHTLNSVIEGEEVKQINTHAVVVRNNGNKTAKNVRITHNVLPNIKIYPDTDYQVNDLPSGGKELVIPQITPKREYTISYLYFPPVTYNQISSVIESDAGPAKIVNVRLQQIFPRWVYFLVGSSMLLGLIAFIYIVFELVRYAFS